MKGGKMTVAMLPVEGGTWLVRLDARGCLVAALHWADEHGPLEGFTTLGFAALDASGRGEFRLPGGRSAPREATHIAARLITADYAQQETLLAPLTAEAAADPGLPPVTFGVMSDIHLVRDEKRLRQALKHVQEADCVLLAGDMTNDGRPEQFARLLGVIDEMLPATPVLAVTGNHDQPQAPLPLVFGGVEDYPHLQARLLARAAALGVRCMADDSGAWRAETGGVTVLGLNAVTHFRRFAFPQGRQLTWLAQQLQEPDARRILLCHAPLCLHHPNRADKQPYLSRDAQLQQLVDDAGRTLFIAGHTHISFSDPVGCVEVDALRRNVYLNTASVPPTTLRHAEPLVDRRWVDGAVTLLRVHADRAEIDARMVSSGKRIARGYYRIPW